MSDSILKNNAKLANKKSSRRFMEMNTNQFTPILKNRVASNKTPSFK